MSAAPPRHRPRVTLPPRPAPARVAGDNLFEDRPAPAAPPSPPANTPPATPEEAERRFWARYGPGLGLADGVKPRTVDEWLRAATVLRSLLTPAAERLADIEDAVRALRELHSQ